MTDYLLRMSRREDRRRMTGRCTITRGTYPDQTAIATDVRCEVRPTTAGRTGEILQAGTDLVMHHYTVRLPYDQDVVRGDVVTVTRSADPLLVGRWVTVREVVLDDELTTRVAICEESVE